MPAVGATRRRGVTRRGSESIGQVAGRLAVGGQLAAAAKGSPFTRFVLTTHALHACNFTGVARTGCIKTGLNGQDGHAFRVGGCAGRIGRRAKGGTRMDGRLEVADLLGNAPEWQERALCSQTDPEAFFPEKGGSTREAKRICSRCEVKSECLEYALGHDERFGIWGGLSERERRKLKRRVA